MARIITNKYGFPLDYSRSFVSIRGKNSFMRLSWDAKDVTAGNVGVALSSAESGVTEEGLDVTDVSAAFKEMSGKCVAKAVNREPFVDFGAADGVVKDVLGGTDCQRTGGRLAGKKPGLYSVKSIVFIKKTGCLLGE